MTKVDVNFDGDTVWLTQDQMAELLQKAKSTINEHIRNVYEEGELDKARTEYRKYQTLELAPVESEYLEAVKGISEKNKGKK